jgi:hypothetical protein
MLIENANLPFAIIDKDRRLLNVISKHSLLDQLPTIYATPSEAVEHLNKTT